MGRKTVIQIERINESIISAVRKIIAGDIEIADNKLIVKVSNPEKENPDIVSAIDAAGGRIQYVTEESSTLEDVYLKLVRSSE